MALPKRGSQAPMSNQELSLAHLDRFPGLRALTWHQGDLYVSRKYSIWKGTPQGQGWEYVARFRPDWTRRISSASRLAGRLRRDGFHALGVLPDGGLVAILPKAIAVCPPGEGEFQVTWRVKRGTRPLAMAVTPGGSIFWGEYFNNPAREEVHVYGSPDGGKSWDVVYSFTAGSIRHVHSVTYDPYGDHLWMCTGDYGDECRIMRVSNDWKVVETVLEGGQQHRAVRPIPTADGLYFATDSELEQNYICRLDSKGVVETLHPTDGPSLWGCRVGSLLFFSTGVEPSKVNLGRHACLYGSADGASWSQLVAWPKDPWHMRGFQYGNIILPQGWDDGNILAASGLAVRGEDNALHLWELHRS